jgi:hypothetical protein
MRPSATQENEENLTISIRWGTWIRTDLHRDPQIAWNAIKLEASAA